MSGLQLKRIFALLLLIGLSKAGLVHRRNAKESISTQLGSETSPAFDLRKDQIPVTILLEKDSKAEQPLAESIRTELPKAELPKAELPKAELPKAELPKAELPTAELPTAELPKAELPKAELPKAELPKTELPKAELPQDNKLSEQNSQQKLEALPALAETELPKNIEEQKPELNAEINIASQRRKDEIVNDDERIDANEQQAEENLQSAINNEQQDSLALDASPQLEIDTGLKVLADPIDGASIAQPDDLQRQATQATPTQTSTPQNFVQQLIQNSPIGQFLSQFTGGQQQTQQQSQQQADEPATPQPTLPGFLNPAAAITSAQQAVQNAAQSVVNSTTQAFQGLQQFATNLGSQFQNTFANLAGQQSQLSTSDSTTTRPPGPIQAIVSNFIGNNPNAEGSTATPGPLQGILGFFQGGNRPQGAAAAVNPPTTAPPKEEPEKKPGVDDKIENQLQNDPIVDKPEEPDSINEVRTSAEVINEDASLEDGPAEDLIVVNDDASQQGVEA